jgi:hypothetical protein
VANGEFVPRRPTASELAVHGTLLDESARAAASARMDRRRFLTTAGGVAAALGVFGLAGCSSSDSRDRAAGRPVPTSTTNGFAVPAPEDVPARHGDGGRGRATRGRRAPERLDAERAGDAPRGAAVAGHLARRLVTHRVTGTD